MEGHNQQPETEKDTKTLHQIALEIEEAIKQEKELQFLEDDDEILRGIW